MSATGDCDEAFSLAYYEPAPDLRRYVSSYYLFRVALPVASDLVRADLGQLRFMVRGTGSYVFAGGGVTTAPESALIGPTTAANGFTVHGPLAVFGIALLPAGWAALVREDASLLADTLVDASVLGAPIGDVCGALRAAPDTLAMVAIADRAIRALIARAAEPPLWFTRMTDDWLCGAASPEVSTLVARSGMSARQIERLAKRIYGASPKLLARKYRALRAASLLGASPLPWFEVVGDAFYDQSHFIREFKHFTGLTPRQFQIDPSPVTRLTLQRRSLAGTLPPLAAVS